MPRKSQSSKPSRKKASPRKPLTREEQLENERRVADDRMAAEDRALNHTVGEACEQVKCVEKQCRFVLQRDPNLSTLMLRDMASYKSLHDCKWKIYSNRVWASDLHQIFQLCIEQSPPLASILKYSPRCTDAWKELFGFLLLYMMILTLIDAQFTTRNRMTTTGELISKRVFTDTKVRKKNKFVEFLNQIIGDGLRLRGPFDRRGKPEYRSALQELINRCRRSMNALQSAESEGSVNSGSTTAIPTHVASPSPVALTHAMAQLQLRVQHLATENQTLRNNEIQVHQAMQKRDEAYRNQHAQLAGLFAQFMTVMLQPQKAAHYQEMQRTQSMCVRFMECEVCSLVAELRIIRIAPTLVAPSFMTPAAPPSCSASVVGFSVPPCVFPPPPSLPDTTRVVEERKEAMDVEEEEAFPFEDTGSTIFGSNFI